MWRGGTTDGLRFPSPEGRGDQRGEDRRSRGVVIRRTCCSSTPQRRSSPGPGSYWNALIHPAPPPSVLVTLLTCARLWRLRNNRDPGSGEPGPGPQAPGSGRRRAGRLGREAVRHALEGFSRVERVAHLAQGEPEVAAGVQLQRLGLGVA